MGIMECGAPLLKHPRQGVLRDMQQAKGPNFWHDREVKNAWIVCNYVNVLNVGLEAWKKQNCREPNLERTYIPPPGAAAWEFQYLSKGAKPGSLDQSFNFKKY